MREKTLTFKIKIGVAATCWTLALAAAFARTIDNAPKLTVWALLAASVAALATSAMVVDLVASQATNRIVDEITAERRKTVEGAVTAMQRDNEALANKIVERLANKQDKTVERVARELVTAMTREENGPTPIR